MLCGAMVGLRLVEEEDLALLATWRNHPQTRQSFFTPLLISQSGQKGWYEGLLKDPTRLQFMIVRLADNVVVGTIGLDRIDHRNQDAEAARLIIDPAVRGHAYGAWALNLLLDYAFRQLNLHRVYAKIFASNGSIRRALDKTPFKEEGVSRKAVFVNGEFCDVINIAVLREEWEARVPADTRDAELSDMPSPRILEDKTTAR